MAKCDLCLDAATDEGAVGFEEEALDLMGDDIADHLCEEIEAQGEVQCSCPCKPAEKKQLRQTSFLGLRVGAKIACDLD